MGLPGRADRRADLLRHHHPEPGARPLVGRVRDLAGRPRASGAGSPAGRPPGSGSCTGAWAAPTCAGSWTSPRPGCSSPRRSGGSATTSTRSCSASPPTLPWALQISPAHRPPGYLRVPTFQPTFLYEMIWNLALAAASDLAQPAGARCRPPGMFALYVAGYSGFRIFEETQRIDYSEPHPRSAAELLHRARAVPDRAGLVRGHPEGLARARGPSAKLGRRTGRAAAAPRPPRPRPAPVLRSSPRDVARVPPSAADVPARTAAGDRDRPGGAGAGRVPL